MTESYRIIRKIKGLPQDGIIYKLVWLGDTRKNPRKESEPSICVILAPLIQQDANGLNSTLKSNTSIDKGKGY